MKYIALIMLILVTCLSFSCKRGEKTKIVIERSTAEKIELPEKLKVTNDLKNIRNGIVAYQTAHDKFPSSLAELKLDLAYPDDYEYDPITGVVKSKSYPDF